MFKKLRENKEIRDAAKGAHVCLWEIADELGIYPTALSYELRHEVEEDRKAELLSIIDKLAAETA